MTEIYKRRSRFITRLALNEAMEIEVPVREAIETERDLRFERER